jgi:hypothetical protein
MRLDHPGCNDQKFLSGLFGKVIPKPRQIYSLSWIRLRFEILMSDIGFLLEPT